MVDLIGNLPTDEQIESLAELAAHPRYRDLANELGSKDGVELTDAVLEYATPEWFKAEGLPLPDGAKVNPRLFEDPNYALPFKDLNEFSTMISTVNNPSNPLNPIVNPGGGAEPKHFPIPPKFPGGISSGDPRAITICASLGGGFGVTACISVGN